MLAPESGRPDWYSDCDRIGYNHPYRSPGPDSVYNSIPCLGLCREAVRRTFVCIDSSRPRTWHDVRIFECIRLASRDCLVNVRTGIFARLMLIRDYDCLRSAYTCTRRSTIWDRLWYLALLYVKVEGLLGDVEGYPWAVV